MYLIFGGRQYYASGGGNDYLGQRDSKERAVEFAERVIGCHAWEQECDISLHDNEIEWAHVFCTETRTIIAKAGSPPYGDCSPCTAIVDKKGQRIV